MELVPAGSLIGMHGAANSDLGGHSGDGSPFGSCNEGNGAALPLANHNDGLTLAGLVSRKAPVNPIRLAVLGADVAAKIGAIDFNRAGGGVGGRLGSDGLTELVRENEGRFVLHIQVAGELQGAVALGPVHEDRDSEQVGADRQLTAGEGRAGRYGELVLTGLALPELAGADEAVREAATARTDRLAARVAPTDHAEGVVRFLGAHTGDLRQRERAGRAGEEEVLRHGANVFRWPWW